MVFLEVRWESGIYSQVTAGIAVQTHVCSAMSGLLFSNKGQLSNLLEAWHCNRDALRGEAGDLLSLSCCHRDIGIHINFQEESGIVTF